jgi:ribosomal protein L11 methyltransferase
LKQSVRGTQGWRLTARVGGAEAAVEIAALLDDLAGAVSAFETSAGAVPAAEWRVVAYPRAPLLDTDLEVRLRLTAAAAGGALIEIAEERLHERDWLGENLRAFPPVRIGRFFIHGSHWRGVPPAGAIPIEIDAASAFGTGEHPTTSGCLLALDALARRRRFDAPLDIGTGSGILAIAAAKRLRRRVLASDIDGESVRVARRHVRRNGLSGLVTVQQGAGYRSRRVRQSQYDLIFANILARPLAAMASDLARSLAPRGRAVLSGLLRRQEAMVLAAHRAQGLALERRLLIDGWSTLVLRAP